MKTTISNLKLRATWLTPLDDRVVGIIPMVIDILNVVPSVNHHFESLGFFSWAFYDYVDNGVTDYLNTPETLEMLDIIDPYVYRNQRNFKRVPKMMIYASQDE